VGAAVSRQERDVDAADVADRERCRWLSVRRLDLDLLDIIEERVEPGAPEDPDAGGGQAERSLALVEAEPLSPDDEVFASPDPLDTESELGLESDFEPESDFLSPEDFSDSGRFFEPSPEDVDRLSVE
jgi:hypothetical protein